MTLVDLFAVAKQFTYCGEIISIQELGNGNINDTFLVTLDAREMKHFILQRINTHVFRQPALVMRNMSIATEHMRSRLQSTHLAAGRRWEILHILLTPSGRDYWVDGDGSFWRAVSFIESAQGFETIQTSAQAGEVGYALGTFHALLSDLPSGCLSDTLEGFHITPLYLSHFEDVIAKFNPRKSPEVDYCLRFVSDRKGLAHVLEDAKARGELRPRTIHGDPKVNNILFDNSTGQAISIVDLDTVKSGLIHYDVGDCLRSSCNPLGEETEQWESVHFDLDLCSAIFQGYLSVAGEFLAGNDLRYFFDSIRLIAFELGLRFFTDHLEGNIYFKMRRPEHNLLRALIQFRLTESIESRETVIRKIVSEISEKNR
jgi:Ser/Thr protein kinase RdoA (MazF antagonist)